MKRSLLVAALLAGAAGLSACSSSPADTGCDGGICPDGAHQDLAPEAVCGAPAGPALKTVVDRILFPTGVMPCSIDIDGDGKLDNALALVVAALRGTFDLQGSADTLLKSGGLIQLLTLQTPSASSAECAQVIVEKGDTPAQAPLFDGSDVFTVSKDFVPVSFSATIASALGGGKLSTPLPGSQTQATVERLSLSLSGGYGVALPLPLYGVHISGNVRNQGLGSGEIHGVVRNDDVQNRIIPAIAQTLSAFIHAHPNTADADSLIGTFETQKKCSATPDLCCAKNPTTCQITADELRQNKLVMTFLKPDVQMFAPMPNGTSDQWKPVVGGDAPDSLSVGLCFTAVTASF